MRRELVLQMKLGRLRPAYFAREVRRRHPRSTSRAQFASLRARRLPRRRPTADGVALTREGLLRVDSLLPRFFLPEHTNIRYT